MISAIIPGFAAGARNPGEGAPEQLGRLVVQEKEEQEEEVLMLLLLGGSRRSQVRW